MRALGWFGLTFGLLGCFAAGMAWKVVSSSEARIERLAAENERLRLFNARETRRLKKASADPRLDSCIRASKALGVPVAVIRAVWDQENGPPDIETGVLGRTDWVALGFPVRDWAAFEAARTMNFYAWRWLTQTQEGRIAFQKALEHAAPAYTDNTLPRAWAQNIHRKVAKDALVSRP